LNDKKEYQENKVKNTANIFLSPNDFDKLATIKVVISKDSLNVPS
jgi:hypothetical protein